MYYALIKRDGTYVKGELPDYIEKEKFCIMCAAAFGAGTTAHKEFGDDVKEVIIKGEKLSVIIEPYEGKLLAVVGDREDMEKAKELVKS